MEVGISEATGTILYIGLAMIAVILIIYHCISTHELADKKTKENRDKFEANTKAEDAFIKETEQYLTIEQRNLLERFIEKCSTYPYFHKYVGGCNFDEFIIDDDPERKGEITRVVSEEEIELFTKLLNTKGLNLSRAQVEGLLAALIDKQGYDEVKSKILANHPKNKRDFVENFLSLYGDNFIFEMGHLVVRLLKENNIDCNPKDHEDLHKIVNEIKMSHLEKNLNSKDREYVSIKDIDLMNGFDFERFLKVLFEKMGYIVKHTQLSGDQGADLVIEKFGKITVVQAKRHSGSISNKAIQEVVASIKHYNADNGMVVTNSSFTPSAVKLASSNKVDLVSREKLVKLISEYL